MADTPSDNLHIEFLDEKNGTLPGTRLFEVRIQKKLTIEEVAKKLHLDASLVLALESNDFDKFPAPIFASGYLRNYARFLGIPPEPLIEAFERLGAEEPPILSELTARMQKSRRRGVEQWAPYLAVGGIVILLLVWLLSGSEPEVSDSEVSVDTQQSAVSSQLPAPDVQQEKSVSIDQRESVAPPTESTPELAEPKSAPELAEPVPPVHKAKSLVLHFTDDSWVEVTDATGRRLFYAMGKAGQTRSMQGKPPFSILLGYSPGVRMEYNGVPFDQTPFTRNDVARFKLGRESD